MHSFCKTVNHFAHLSLVFCVVHFLFTLFLEYSCCPIPIKPSSLRLARSSLSFSGMVNLWKFTVISVLFACLLLKIFFLNNYTWRTRILIFRSIFFLLCWQVVVVLSNVCLSLYFAFVLHLELTLQQLIDNSCFYTVAKVKTKEIGARQRFE